MRCGDVIYYGSMKDKYVVKLEIKSKKKVKDMDVADRVTVQLMYTDPNIRTRKQIVKTSEKEGLYLASNGHCGCMAYQGAGGIMTAIKAGWRTECLLFHPAFCLCFVALYGLLSLL